MHPTLLDAIPPNPDRLPIFYRHTSTLGPRSYQPSIHIESYGCAIKSSDEVIPLVDLRYYAINIAPRLIDPILDVDEPSDAQPSRTGKEHAWMSGLIKG